LDNTDVDRVKNMAYDEAPAPSRPRVLVLSFSRIARDPRVLRQIHLFQEFADVISCGYGPAPDGVIRHVEIPENLPAWHSSKSRVGFLLGVRRYHRLYFGADKVRLVQDQIPAGSVDVVVANDVLAVPLAVSLKPRRGVHADLHEYAPKQGEDDLKWRLSVGPFMDWACRQYVTKADSVSTVAEGIADEYASVYGIPKPSIVPNASAYDDRANPTPVHSPLRLVHTGAAGRVRRIEVMIEAVRRANELRPGTATLDLVLVPGEQRYIDELAQKVATVPGGAVRMKAPVPFEQIVPMLQAYDIGFYLCPPRNFNMEHALPNKLFEFIQARLALLIGPSPEMQALVERHGVGLVAGGFDAESAAVALTGMTEADVLRMKEASHAAAKELSAEATSSPWPDAVRKIAGVSNG
jgi:hypothetical protein